MHTKATYDVRVKVTYIITRADHYGGAQIHIRDLSIWMKSQGCSASVIAGNTGSLSTDLTHNDIAFSIAPSLKRSIHPIADIISFFQIRRILKKDNPDIVSCHSSKAGIVGRLATWSLCIPSVFTAHGWSFTDGISPKKRLIYKWVERFGALFGNHIITVSRYDKVLALRNKVTRAKKMTVIHNGKPYRAPKKSHYNDIPQLCMVARFSPQKDHKTLINALGGLKNHKWHLNLVGDGTPSEAKAQAEQLGILDKITFHGQMDNVPEYLESQDAFILASHWEGFPRSIIEAMRASLPVITTRTAGSPESVRPFKTGYIVPERNAKALERAINLLISDPIRRFTMGEAGRIRYESRFTFNDMAEKTINVYQTVLALKPSKRFSKRLTFAQSKNTQ